MELKKLSLDMMDILYEFYCELSIVEFGVGDEIKDLTKDKLVLIISDKLNNERKILNDIETPSVVYILFDNNIPIGEITLRTKTNDKWNLSIGNISYRIRKSQRGKGYGNKLLELATDLASSSGLDTLYLSCNILNDASKKVISNNGGKLILKDEYQSIYTINVLKKEPHIR